MSNFLWFKKIFYSVFHIRRQREITFIMINIGIAGYGNLGKACERIAAQSNIFEVKGIFTRRNPSEVVSPLFGTPVYAQSEICDFEGEIDVVCICTGSAHDVTDLGKSLARRFNTVDSFDTHAEMRGYVSEMNRIATQNDRLCFVGIGWDPGLFSLMRALFCGVLPDGDTQTFWGRGVSQGHSEAIRRIDGVANAKQYTVPKEEAIRLAGEGKAASLCDRDRHMRECYVVAKDGADREAIREKIVTMPNYFAPYDTTVTFVSEEEFEKNHSTMAHGGFVMRSGEANGTRHNLEFSLRLDSNPDFTASVLMAYAAANARLYESGLRGAKTVLDVPVSALFDGCYCDIVKKFV